MNKSILSLLSLIALSGCITINEPVVERKDAYEDYPVRDLGNGWLIRTLPTGEAYRFTSLEGDFIEIKCDPISGTTYRPYVFKSSVGEKSFSTLHDTEYNIIISNPYGENPQILNAPLNNFEEIKQNFQEGGLVTIQNNQTLNDTSIQTSVIPFCKGVF